MASAAVRSKATVLLLFNHYLFCSNCLCGFSVKSMFCFAVLCVLSTFAIISLGKRELVTLHLLCS